MTIYRLHRLQLENFRAYRKLDLDLSADVTLLYGRNGIGKTAIFDAIEYLLTGELGRFVRFTNLPEDHLGHVLADGGRALARLELAGPGDPWAQVERQPGEETFTFSSHPGGGRNDFLYQTLGVSEKLPARQEVKLVANLIRASIMLSQDSLREFIEAEGSRRKPLLANLAGLGFYERCLEKTVGVVNEGQRRGREVENRLAELGQTQAARASELADEEQRLTALEDVAGTLAALPIEVVQQRFVQLGGQWPNDTLMAWDAARAAGNFCTLRAETATQQLGTVAALREGLPLFREEQKRHARLTVEIADRRGAVATALSEETAAQTSLVQTRHDRDVAERAAREHAAVLGILREFSRHLGREATTQREKAQAAARLAAAELTRDEVQKTRDQVARSANDLEARLAHAEAEAEALAARVAQLHVLRDEGYFVRRLPPTPPQWPMVSLAGGPRDNLPERRRAAMAESELLNERMVEQKLRLEELVKTISGHTAASDDFIRLAALAQQRNTAGECPLCGQDHGSEDALHAAMDRMLTAGSHAVANLQREEQSIREELQRQKLRAAELLREIEAADRAISEANTRYQATREAFDAQRRRARELAVPENATVEVVLATEEAEARAKTERNTLDGQLAVARAGLVETRTRFTQAEREVILAQTVLTELAGQQEEDARERTRLLAKLPALSHVPPSDLPAAVAGQITSYERDQQAARTLADTLVAELVEGGARLRASDEKRRALEQEITVREQEAAELSTRLHGFTARLTAFKVPLETADSDLGARWEALDAERVEAQAVADLLHATERETRRAASRAERDRLRKDLDDLAVTVDTAKVEADKIAAATDQAYDWQQQLRPALDRVVRKRLEEHRGEAFQLFKSLVPTAHQFADVEVSPQGEEVNFSLRYRGGPATGSGEPRFFLSGAQSNALALSFFLSFARRQEWCRLRALLLDDPVQHLDDLDAVALLDLLREVALVQQGPTRRQMVLSTCDLNLYHLMLRKFAALDQTKVRLRAYTIADGGFNLGPEPRLDWPSVKTVSQVAA